MLAESRRGSDHRVVRADAHDNWCVDCDIPPFGHRIYLVERTNEIVLCVGRKSTPNGTFAGKNGVLQHESLGSVIVHGMPGRFAHRSLLWHND